VISPFATPAMLALKKRLEAQQGGGSMLTKVGRQGERVLAGHAQADVVSSRNDIWVSSHNG
jgi:hypothetical protein